MPKWDKPGHYDTKDRDRMKKGDFAGPHKSFPIQNAKDVQDAARLSGHAANPAQVRKNIKKIAEEKGLPVPKSMQNNKKK